MSRIVEFEGWTIEGGSLSDSPSSDYLRIAEGLADVRFPTLRVINTGRETEVYWIRPATKRLVFIGAELR